VTERALEAPLHAALAAEERARLQRKARLLAWGGNVWHFLEGAVALAAGVAAGSIALIAFAIDSIIETLAGFVIAWRFAPSRAHSEHAERRAQQLIAASYGLLAVYVVVEATRSLVEREKPAVSWIGIVLVIAAAVSMPLLARAKRRVGRALHSHATVSEASQNQICAYLALTTLAGLGANALLGWWWADPVAALGIAGIAAWEGVRAWRGDVCDEC
jgi:divalent metal cation (Fe/Co/Zn/Cd) transporter